MKRRNKFQRMAALMLGMAMTCVMMTSCSSNDDNPVEGDVPNVGQGTVKELKDLRSSDVGWVIGADGKAYSSGWQAMANHTETVAVLTYISITPDDVLHFLAIAFRDEKETIGGYTFNWQDAKARCEAKDKIAGCEWRLPSMKDWELMIFRNSVERTGKETCDDFWSLQLSAGFQDFTDVNWYWSSDEVVENGNQKVRVMLFTYEGEHMYADFGMGSRFPNESRVTRAVLAYNM